MNKNDDTREDRRDEQHERRQGLHIVPSLQPENPASITADDELRELIKQLRRPARKKTPTNELPPAA